MPWLLCDRGGLQPSVLEVVERIKGDIETRPGLLAAMVSGWMDADGLDWNLNRTCTYPSVRHTTSPLPNRDTRVPEHRLQS